MEVVAVLVLIFFYTFMALLALVALAVIIWFLSGDIIVYKMQVAKMRKAWKKKK